jgi:hypothetical protein
MLDIRHSRRARVSQLACSAAAAMHVTFVEASFLSMQAAAAVIMYD